MLTVYPSNRLEDLSQLLNAVLQHRQNSVLQADTIIVDNKGMQHWLNLQLASMQNIAMNIKFQMPASFIWELSRSILGDDVSLQNSPYQRDIMSWCLDQLMASQEFIDAEYSKQAVEYWGGKSKNCDQLKRFQLATRLGDLFEQYILYRPDWIERWSNTATANTTSYTTSYTTSEDEKWQAWLWQQLDDYFSPIENPISLHNKAIAAMAKNKAKLPKQVLLFALNTLPPKTLDFFKVLSEYTQVHIFHLNPCVEFWGDVQSDASKAKQIRMQQLQNWTNEDERSNPLLANLAQQGKEFFNLLQSQQAIEIDAFDFADEAAKKLKSPAKTVLQLIQNDILNLYDRTEEAIEKVDDSLSIHSCHSALREIQLLHDYLLSLFNDDTDLSTQDILVMCPAIEDYAPYINAVFRHPWEQAFNADDPRLPCSIADRSIKDSEPLVAHFLDLMALPDSRFEVSKILDYIHLPALQNKFGFNDGDLQIIKYWLHDSSVHWGQDAKHKAHLIKLKESNALYTWQWGLERLLVGFAYTDSEIIYAEQLLMPHVEGQKSVLLGRLMQLLESLQLYVKSLTTKRTAKQWQDFLVEMFEHFYQLNKAGENAQLLIKNVINDFAEHTLIADYQGEIELAVMRHYLQQHFSQVASSHQFLTGQITFCSMIPMRSIPFKVIAILGLNDGKFPRQNIPLSFDLISTQGRRKGDRSRRADDRYLFLEALISAREKLYLSYQGRDIKNNSVRQPSLLLKELLDYLENGFSWKIESNYWQTEINSAEQVNNLHQHPLHPFSNLCYQGEYPSFDQKWLQLVTKGLARNNHSIALEPLILTEQSIDIGQLISFFSDPLKAFAQQRLSLYFEQNEQLIDDIEPFDFSNLLAYKIRQDLCLALIENSDPSAIRERYLLSGDLADSPLATINLDSWQQQAEELANAVKKYPDISLQSLTVSVSGIKLSAKIPYLNSDQQSIDQQTRYQPNKVSLLLWRSATIKAKDEFSLWIYHLMASMAQSSAVTSIGIFYSSNKNPVKTIAFNPITTAEAKLQLEKIIFYWQRGLSKPSLLYADLGQLLIHTKKNYRKDFQPLEDEKILQCQAWQKKIEEAYLFTENPYFAWFYPHLPELTSTLHEDFYDLYQALYANLSELKS